MILVVYITALEHGGEERSCSVTCVLCLSPSVGCVLGIGMMKIGGKKKKRTEREELTGFETPPLPCPLLGQRDHSRLNKLSSAQSWAASSTRAATEERPSSTPGVFEPSTVSVDRHIPSG